MAKQTLKTFIQQNFKQTLLKALDDQINEREEFSNNPFELIPTEEFYSREVTAISCDITSMQVNNLHGEQVQLFLSAEVSCEVKEKFFDFYDRLVVEPPQYISGTVILECTGSPVLEFQDFRVVHIHPKTYKPVLDLPMTEDLVPIIPDNRLDYMAERIVSTYLPEVPAWEIDEMKLAEAVGLKICYADFGDSETKGRIFFTDTDEFGYLNHDFDDKTKPTVPITAGTAVIQWNTRKCHNQSKARNTIAHEIIHWVLHRKAMYLYKLLNQQPPVLCCFYEIRYAKRNVLYEIERQANRLAPRVLMPYSTFLATAQNLREMRGDEHPYLNETQLLEVITKDLANLYCVSYQSASIRMEEVGFEKARGTMKYIDEHYVPPYTTCSGTFETSIDYLISIEGFMEVTDKDPAIAKAVWDGNLLFLENHLVQNKKQYVTTTDEGSLQLTDYARTHIDECCIGFWVRRQFSEFYNGEPTGELFKKEKAKVRYFYTPAKNIELAHQELNDAERAVRTFEEDEAYMENFPYGKKNALKYCLKKCPYTQLQLEEITSISQKHISNIANGHVDNPSMDVLLALGIAMRIPKRAYRPLLKCYGHYLDEEDRCHRFYDHLISTYPDGTLKEWNEMLKKAKLQQIPYPRPNMSADLLEHYETNVLA